jgi:hypothetical protein
MPRLDGTNWVEKRRSVAYPAAPVHRRDATLARRKAPQMRTLVAPMERYRKMAGTVGNALARASEVRLDLPADSSD